MVIGDTPDERLSCVADQQRGRINTAQLYAIGFTAAMIKRRLQTGHLRRLYRGVYAVGHIVAIELGDETAALLAVRASSLGHRSATMLWELTASAPPEIELVLPEPLYARSRPGIRVHRSATLTVKDLQLHRGLPVTTPTRTLFDLAATRELREVERALDEALHRRLTSPTKIREAAARTPTHPGARPLIALLDPARGLGVTRGEAEERMLGLIRAASLPDPERNAQVGPYEVDFLWRAAALAVEVDSYAWHSGPWAFKRDRRKDAFLKDQGLDVLRVTWEMMDEPLPLVARIARRIAERTARPA